MDLIHLSKAKAKYIRSLHALKHRQKYNKYIAEGHKICKEIIISNPSQIEYIVSTETWVSKNKDILSDLVPKLLIATPKDLKQVSVLSTPSEVLLVADKQDISDKVLLKSQPFLLYLDGIRNPGNMGAILRIADWYGMRQIICSPDCVDLYNPKVIQSSMGSFLRVELIAGKLTSFKENGYAILGAAMDGKTIHDLAIPSKMVLAIGNEGSGVSDETRALIDQWVCIDGSKKIGAESLNAAVATGILIDQITSKM